MTTEESTNAIVEALADLRREITDGLTDLKREIDFSNDALTDALADLRKELSSIAGSLNRLERSK